LGLLLTKNRSSESCVKQDEETRDIQNEVNNITVGSTGDLRWVKNERGARADLNREISGEGNGRQASKNINERLHNDMEVWSSGT
jgi:hypothetical protein